MEEADRWRLCNPMSGYNISGITIDMGVVEVVDESTGESTDGFHLLGLTQLGF